MSFVVFLSFVVVSRCVHLTYKKTSCCLSFVFYVLAEKTTKDMERQWKDKRLSFS